jgi:hypothetical protein
LLYLHCIQSVINPSDGFENTQKDAEITAVRMAILPRNSPPNHQRSKTIAEQLHIFCKILE